MGREGEGIGGRGCTLCGVTAAAAAAAIARTSLRALKRRGRSLRGVLLLHVVRGVGGGRGKRKCIKP